MLRTAAQPDVCDRLERDQLSGGCGNRQITGDLARLRTRIIKMGMRHEGAFEIGFPRVAGGLDYGVGARVTATPAGTRARE